MKKLICSLLIPCFLSASAAAYIPSSLWVMGEMAKRCGANSSADLPGVYSNLGEITSTTKQSVYFLGEFITCSGVNDHENVTAFTTYLNLHGVAVDEISLGFFVNQVAYIIGKVDGPRLLVDKETFLPVQEIVGDTEVTFTNWLSTSDNKKKFPSKIFVKTGVQESHFDFVQNTNETGKNDAGIFR